MGLYTEQGVVSRRRQEPRPHHQRDPRGRHQAAHRAARRPAHRRRRPSRTGSSAASAGTGTPCCATARWTCGCTSRTYAARSACPAAWTRRPPSTRRTTSPRASASWSPSGSAPPPAPPSCSRSPGSAPFAFTVNENGRGERLTEIPADPTVRLADRPRGVHRARRRAAYPGAGLGRRHRRHRSSDSRSSTPWRSPLDDEDRPLVPLGHAGPGRAGPSWSPARRSGGLGHHTALELARRGGAGGPRRPEPGQAGRDRGRDPRSRSRAPTLEQLDGRPRRPGARYAGRRPMPGRSARSTCWSTTPA